MTLVGAAICSYAPMVLPEYAGLTDAGAAVRCAARMALDVVRRGGVDVLVVLAPHTAPGRTRWAGPRHARPELALRVARVLLDDPAAWPRVEEVVLDGSASEEAAVAALRARPERLGLLVLADAPAADGGGSGASGTEASWSEAVRRGDAVAAARLPGGEEATRLGDTAAGLRVLGEVAAGAHVASTVFHAEPTGGVEHVAAAWVVS